jgi:hypothetical protein
MKIPCKLLYSVILYFSEIITRKKSGHMFSRDAFVVCRILSTHTSLKPQEQTADKEGWLYMCMHILLNPTNCSHLYPYNRGLSWTTEITSWTPPGSVCPYSSWGYLSDLIIVKRSRLDPRISFQNRVLIVSPAYSYFLAFVLLFLTFSIWDLTTPTMHLPRSKTSTVHCLFLRTATVMPAKC